MAKPPEGLRRNRPLPSLLQLGPSGLAPVQAGECQFHYVGAAAVLPAGERQAIEQAARAVFAALQQEAQVQESGFGKHVLVRPRAQCKCMLEWRWNALSMLSMGC